MLPELPKGNEAIKKLSWWHESIIDWMLLNPDQDLGVCALFFNVGQPWLSRIVNSQLFKTRLAYRRQNHAEAISHSVLEKCESLADLTLETLLERVAAERDSISLGELRDTTELALSAIGYGVKGRQPSTPPQAAVQINIVSPESIVQAQQAWRIAARQQAEEIANGNQLENQTAQALLTSEGPP